MNNINLTEPPKFNELTKNERLYVIYNEVVRHIERLKQSGRIPEGGDLSALGITTQIITESGWANSGLSNRANNFGGLTAGSQWKGKIDTVVDDPMTGGTYDYRVFNTPLEGIRAQVEFYLPDVNSRYSKHGVLKAKTPQEHFAAVQRAGYAEAKNYVSSNINLLNGTIKPRLKRGSETEGIKNWYSKIDNYNTDEKFKKQVNQFDIANNEELKANIKLEESGNMPTNMPTNVPIENLPKENQSLLNSQAMAKKNNILAPSTESILGLSQYSNKLDASEKTVSPETQNFRGNLTAVISDEQAKADQKQQIAELKREKQIDEFINAAPIDASTQQPVFGQGQLFGVNKKKTGGHLYPRYLENGGPGDKELKDKEDNLNGRVGPEINPTYSFGQTPRKLGHISGYGKKYFFSPDSKKFDNFIDPISFNVDAETGNKKKYNFDTGKFEVTDIPYVNKGEPGVSMMSHRADIYEDGDMSEEAQSARLEKAEEMLKHSETKGNRAMQQFADRSDYSAKNRLGLQEQGVSQKYWDTYKNQFQCISGSSSNCSPIPGMPMDKNQPNYATVPHYVKDKSNRGDFKLNKNASAGTQKNGKGTSGPGDNIPVMGGNETFASWGTRNYGFEFADIQSPLKKGQILVQKGYDDWRARNRGVPSPTPKKTFQYGRVEGYGPYHAKTVGNIGTSKDYLNDGADYYGEEKGFQIGNNPGSGAYVPSSISAVGSAPRRTTAQLNWTGDSPYYKAILANKQKRDNLSKKD
tara:strand:- start:356 stop:2614 length:2259 start_codon:yes stop_codon:yes gene_type:complete